MIAESFLLEIFYGYSSIYYANDSVDYYLDKAALIDPHAGQLYTMKGAQKYYLFQFDEAIELIEKGIELDPNYPYNYFYLSYISIYGSEPVPNLEALDKAIGLDPLNSMFKTSKVLQCIYLREYNMAKGIIDIKLEEKPGDNMALFLKGLLLCHQKKYKEPLETLLERSVGDTTSFLVAYVQGMVGNDDMAHKIINILIKRRESRFVSPITIAVAYMGIEEYEKALEWIEIGMNETDGWRNFLNYGMFEPLYQDPRYFKLVETDGCLRIFQNAES